MIYFLISEVSIFSKERVFGNSELLPDRNRNNHINKPINIAIFFLIKLKILLYLFFLNYF